MTQGAWALTVSIGARNSHLAIIRLADWLVDFDERLDFGPHLIDLSATIANDCIN